MNSIRTLAPTLVLSTRSIRTASIAFRSATPLLQPRFQARTMSSLLASTAAAAHQAFAAVASASPIKAGDAVPDVEIKVNDLEDKVNFSKLTGKNVLVLVPGAFSPTCSSQVPSYVSSYSQFKTKGVQDVYVVSVNDMFVMKAWGQKLEADAGDNQGKVKYAGDDAGKLTAALGLVLDAQAIFGGPRSQRGAIVIDNGKVLSVAVEPSPAEVTVSHADEVLKNL